MASLFTSTDMSATQLFLSLNKVIYTIHRYIFQDLLLNVCESILYRSQQHQIESPTSFLLTSITINYNSISRCSLASGVPHLGQDPPEVGDGGDGVGVDAVDGVQLQARGVSHRGVTRAPAAHPDTTHCLYTVLGPTRPHLSMTGMSRSGVQGQARARLRHHSCMPAYILMMAV